MALVGSYRKGGMNDQAVEAVLDGAREAGAEVEKVYLLDQATVFCTNCRRCTQEPGPERGICPLEDEMPGLLDRIEVADALVLGSPMNAGTVTAVTKRFIERLICCTFWPWGTPAPRMRRPASAKRAVLVASAAASASLGRLTSKMVKLLQNAVEMLGAGSVGVLFVGLAAAEPKPTLSERYRRRARRLGRRLVAS